jgi:hypothetical protein
MVLQSNTESPHTSDIAQEKDSFLVLCYNLTNVATIPTISESDLRGSKYDPVI